VRAWTAEFRQGDGNARRYDRAKILADAATMTRAEVVEKHGCSTRFLSHLLAGKLDPTPTDQEPKLNNN